jgi:hypothetical protein
VADDRDSSKYRRDLEKLFSSSGETPERFREVMETAAPEPGTPEAERREAIQRLREADQEGFRPFCQAVDVYRVQGHDMPDDAELLARMLDHPGEEVVREALAHIEDLHRRRTIDRIGPIKNRLSTIKTMSDDPRTLNLVKQVEEIFEQGG